MSSQVDVLYWGMPFKTQISALLALSLGLAAAAPATLTLDAAAQPQPLPPTVIGGFNLGNWMPVVEALGDLRSVAPTLLRFPGGNVGDENDLAAANFIPLKSNMQLLTTGAQPPKLIVQTRVFGGKPGARNSPQDAANAVGYAAEAGLKVDYWEIGNEPDLYSKNRGDASWTPTRYCNTFRAQRAAMLKVDPQAKFAGPVTSNGNGPADTFLRDFVKQCGDAIDLLTWHEYPNNGSGSDADALNTVSVIDRETRAYRALLDSPQDNPLGYQKNTPLGITEYSLSYKSDNPRHLSDQVGALWAAEATVRLAEDGGSVAAYFALMATSNHGLVDEADFPRPSLYTFQQIHAFTGSWLPIKTDDAALWTHAAVDGSRLTVLVTNTDTAVHPLSAAIPGYQLSGVSSAIASMQQGEEVGQIISLPVSATLDLPARSMTRLVYQKQ